MTPIENPEHRELLTDVLESAWRPDNPSWTLEADGAWTVQRGSQAASSQRLLYEAAVARSLRG
jgi:polyphosphate kinase